jgi:hypothetical protein
MATRGRHLASHSNLNRTAAKSESVGGSSRDKILCFVGHSICKRFSSNIFKKKFWMALPLWLRVCECALTRRCACALLPVFSYPHVHRLSDFNASRILVNSRIRYSRNSRILVNSRIRNSRNSRILVNSRIRNSWNSRFADSEFENSQEF